MVNPRLLPVTETTSSLLNQYTYHTWRWESWRAFDDVTRAHHCFRPANTCYLVHLSWCYCPHHVSRRYYSEGASRRWCPRWWCGGLSSHAPPPPPLLWIVSVIPKPWNPLSLFAQLGRHFFSGRFPFSTVLSLICVVFGCTRCFPSGICDWSLFLANVTGKRKPKKNVSNTLYSLCLTGDFVTQSASSRLRTKHQDMILKTEKRSQLIWISFANCDQSQTTYLQSSVNSNPYTLNHGLLTPNPRL